jgi:hypothetical protein
MGPWKCWQLCGLGLVSLGLVAAATQQLLGETSTGTLLNLKPAGGQFMTEGIGSNIPSFTNFYYVLPARAIYILMTPMPWFGAESVLEQIDFIVSHLAALYYFSVLGALTLTFLYRKRIPATKERNILLLLGVMFFVIPIFFFSPSRRYVTICAPYFLAYALPALFDRKKVLLSVAGAIIVILAVQALYLGTGH